MAAEEEEEEDAGCVLTTFLRPLKPVLTDTVRSTSGFARRYFQLQQSGWLSYSFEPGQLSRDQIFLPQAAISSTPGRRDIHIDCATATFHVKCLSAEDFNMWMTAFRKFLARESPPMGASSLGRRSTVRSTLRAGQYNRFGGLVEEMGITINELQNAVTAWQDNAGQQRGSIQRSKSEKDKKDRAKEHGGHVLGIFKKAAPHAHNQHAPDPGAKVQPSDTPSPADPSFQRVQAILDALRHQQAALAKLALSYSPVDTNPHSAHGSHLSRTTEEDGERTPIPTASRNFRRFSTTSDQSGGSGSGSVWFDAPEGDGAEEFVVEATPGEEHKESEVFGEGRYKSPQPDPASSTEIDDTDTDADTDSEETSEVEPAETASTSPELPNQDDEKPVVRRTQLPSGPVGDEGSLFAVLKKNVGKDLSQVAMPVTFNEPLTLLQKVAEELEYHDLLSQAAHSDNPVERMCYIAAFAVSTYANTKHRTGRKGFNPMLAETFEDPRMRFIAEKVSHNPVILAYHAEGDGWKLWATSSGKTKFWGKSLEIIPQGTTHLQIGEEYYQWKRPSSFMRNLMMGTKYLEHCGKMVIENTTTGARCNLDFKEGGYWGPTNMVSGSILSSSGNIEADLEGKWDEQMSLKLDSSHLRVLWRMTPFSKNALDYYGFTSFGITLNEITSDLQSRLPPTDSRLRTDVRALEEGDLDLAEDEKKRIEEMQRDRRRRGADRQPRWFKQSGDEWVYAGGYWEQRARGWKDVEPLW
ncbi:uncharacterized protein FIBRA_04905 [Fibroporia radiculosa]|uniref:Pleckstrin homology domain-containing protein n=1 Tax=Fibroporia radiculosa TaxID=599839 RepID=J4H377_9APHY|nr:uncharacterized protein FIBRA_04905 [Fibroporia radiculosa]CCM02794.1 predicted protein [Fibroporia radiculosa]